MPAKDRTFRVRWCYAVLARGGRRSDTGVPGKPGPLTSRPGRFERRLLAGAGFQSGQGVMTMKQRVYRFLFRLMYPAARR
jgi:hypothetical protein